MLQQLLQQQDFLALTLAHPHYLAPETLLIGGHTQCELWDTGVLCLSPVRGDATCDIVLSCGIHGNETAPIELCNQLLQEILSGQMPLRQRLLLIIGNPPAILQGTRIVDENLNRLFCGEHANPAVAINPERKRAALLEQYVARFFGFPQPLAHLQSAPQQPPRQRLHYDLHTAIRGSKHERFAVCPYRPQQPYQRRQLALLQSAGVNAFMLHHEPTTTFSYFSCAYFAAEAYTVELGKVAPLGHNDLQRLAATQQLLAQLLSSATLPSVPFDEAKAAIYQVSRVINKQQADFAFSFGKDVENFTAFAKDSVLATESGQIYSASTDGEAVVFPNANVPVGQRAAICVVPAPAGTVL